jgi:flagellar motility protein MotE (MotC chaperone)
MKKRRDIRIVPVAIFAAVCLVALKVTGLLLDGGFILQSGERNALADAKISWAQEIFNFPVPGRRAVDGSDVTGSVAADKPKDAGEKPATKPAESLPVDGTVVVPDSHRPVPASERAILERLQARRQELESRARELEIRENLLKAAEKRIDTRVEELKEIEQKIGAANERKEQNEGARLKSLVSMYENMKPKDAAKVFDRLDMAVLLELASQMNPRRMSDILAQMSAEAAERLTVELAKRAGGDKIDAASNLPKIEGRPAQPATRLTNP